MEEQEIRRIVITQYSTYRGAVCELCRWVSVDQKRLMENVATHKRRHDPPPAVVERKFQPKEQAG